jgi:hypothetical protein
VTDRNNLTNLDVAEKYIAAMRFTSPGSADLVRQFARWLDSRVEPKDPYSVGLHENPPDRSLEGLKSLEREIPRLYDEPGGRLFWHPGCASCKAGHVPCEHGYHASCPECRALNRGEKP